MSSHQDKLVTGVQNSAYSEGWDRIWGKKSSHPFNLEGAEPGDWFFGCIKCSRQLPFRAAVASNKLCACGGIYKMYTVTEEDLNG